MQIIVNGSSTDVPAAFSIAALIEHMALTGRRIAVEVNEQLVPRSRFAEHHLNEGDRVEIIHAVGGG
jgi:sulfur carrier protein